MAKLSNGKPDRLTGFRVKTEASDLGTFIKAGSTVYVEDTATSYLLTEDALPTDTIAGITSAIRANPEFLGIITPTNGDENGVQQQTSITCIADPGDFARVIINTTSDAGSAYDGEYFILEDENGTVAFWFDVDDDGTTEPVHGADRSVEITTVLTADAENTVIDKIVTALNADAKFQAIEDGSNIINVYNTNPCATTSQSTGTVTFTTFSIVNAGADSVLNGTYFIAYDDVGSVAFYLIADNSKYHDATLAWESDVAEPSHGADRSVKVNFTPEDSSASTVASHIEGEIDGDSKFSAARSSEVLTVTASTYGEKTDSVDGDTGFTIATSVTGNNTGYNATPEAVVGSTGINAGGTLFYVKVDLYNWKSADLSDI